MQHELSNNIQKPPGISLDAFLSTGVQDETSLKLLQFLSDNPNHTQRELAQLCGISLGKVNYVLKALIEKGALKWCNFKTQEYKMKCVYLLTPLGVAEKANLTCIFLKRKMAEFDRLKREIDQLKEQSQD